MVGAIAGDIIGSIYEHYNIKTKDFSLFNAKCRVTDDTVMTCAIADAVMSVGIESEFYDFVVKKMQSFGKKYPNAGYGRRFISWLFSDDPKPYYSYGNGSAMRVSPVTWFAESLEQAEQLAEIQASVTHNHPEGIKGAKAVASAIYLARTGATKDQIRSYVQTNYYDLSFSLDEIRDAYSFDVSCQGSIPQAIEAFLESTDFEDAIRNAISIGGDSDTIAAITGSIAEAYYGVPEWIEEKAVSYLDDTLFDVYARFKCYQEMKQ